MKTQPLARKFALAVVLCGAAMCVDAAAQGADASASTAPPASGTAHKTINGVVVKPDPLSKSDRHLAAVKKSLPASGDAPSRPDAARSDPNAATGEQRKMMERASNPPQGPDPDAGFTSAHP